MRRSLWFFLSFITLPVMADEPTVSFTQSELQLYNQAIQAAAIAQYTAQQAKPVQTKFSTPSTTKGAPKCPASPRPKPA